MHLHCSQGCTNKETLNLALSSCRTLKCADSRQKEEVCPRPLYPPFPLLFLPKLNAFTPRACYDSFWPTGELDGLPVMGLALGDYRYKGMKGYERERKIILKNQEITGSSGKIKIRAIRTRWTRVESSVDGCH